MITTVNKNHALIPRRRKLDMWRGDYRRRARLQTSLDQRCTVSGARDRIAASRDFRRLAEVNISTVYLDTELGRPGKDTSGYMPLNDGVSLCSGGFYQEIGELP